MSMDLGHPTCLKKKGPKMTTKETLICIGIGAVIGLMFWLLNGRFYLKVGPIEIHIPRPDDWGEEETRIEDALREDPPSRIWLTRATQDVAGDVYMSAQSYCRNVEEVGPYVYAGSTERPDDE